MCSVLRHIFRQRNQYLVSNTFSSRIGLLISEHHTWPKLLNMNEARVRYDEGSDNFTVSFRYINLELKIDRQFNFCRNINETIDHFLNRVESNILVYINKKIMKRKKKDSENFTVPDSIKNKEISLLKDEIKIDGNLPCEVIVKESLPIKLIVYNMEYSLVQNIPCITNVSLPPVIYANYPVYPYKFECEFTDKSRTVFNWYKQEAFKSNIDWIHVGEGYVYMPSVSDIGYMLKLECLPKNDKHNGSKVEVQSNVIEEGPGTCLFEARHVFTKSKLFGDRFRIMSYNILADVYSNTEYSKEVLFSYCPSHALDMEYRKHLIQKEIIGFNADIICLQEVDTKVYQNHLNQVLSCLKYNSEYSAKNKLQEGLAIFFNEERFKKLDFEYSVISQGIQLKEFNDIWSSIKNENVKNRLLARNTIIQAITLQSKENLSEILIVGNTHLYFKPDAQHIRLLQTYYAVTHLHNLAKQAKAKYPKCNVSILFCGDFNGSPACGAYQLICEKYVSEKCADWFGNPEEIVENISLTHQVNLSSAYGTPKYTNYTPTFAACLDYIFYEKDNLEVIQTVPIPSEEEVALHKGLPSIVCPSDHISLCADLKWSNK